MGNILYAVPGDTQVVVVENQRFEVEHGLIEAPDTFAKQLAAHGCKVAGHRVLDLDAPIEISAREIPALGTDPVADAPGAAGEPTDAALREAPLDEDDELNSPQRPRRARRG